MPTKKIEIDMLQALRGDKPWRSGNTRVELDPAIGPYSRLVILHGHCIAKRDEHGDWWINLCGWNTQTTRSRLNAIIRDFTYFPSGSVGVTTRNRQASLTDTSGAREIPHNAWVKVL